MSHLRFAWRSIRRAPWFSLVVVGILGLGMGLGTTAFAVVDGVLFKPLPYAAPYELYMVSGVNVGLNDMEEWRRAVPDVRFASSGTLTGLGTFRVVNGSNIWSLPVDRQYLAVLGVRPLLGGFSDADFEQRTTVIPGLITYGLWQRRFAGDVALLGTEVDFGSRRIRIAGVLPAAFRFSFFGRSIDVLTPLVIPAEARAAGRAGSLYVIARVPSNVALPTVRQRLSALVRAARAVDPTAARSVDAIDIDPFADVIAQGGRPRFWLVFGAVALVLLLVTINVAGLVASRSIDRLRDAAIRRALGASSITLAKGLIAEVSLLAVIGAIAGVALAGPLLTATIRLLPENVALMRDPVVDVRVLALVAITTAVVIGLVTVMSFIRLRTGRLTSVINEGAGARAARSSLGSRLIIAAQIAMGLVLLVGGSLMVRSLMRVWDEDPGFVVDRTVRLDVRFSSGEGLVERTRALLDTLNGVPGVYSVAALDAPFLARAAVGNPFSTPEGRRDSRGDIVGVTPGFFSAMGVTPLQGRVPTDNELGSRVPLAVLSEAAAGSFWPGESAVGRTLSSRQGTVTVVGVVNDARFLALDSEPRGQIYVPYGWISPSWPTIIVRTRDAEARMVPSLIDAVRQFDAAAEIRQARTMREALAETIRLRRFQAWLFAAFGLAATVVVGTGLLGLIGMMTARRTREVGIRMALGATPAMVIRQLLGEQLLTIVAGLVVGTLASAWLVGFVKALLYKTTTADVWAWGASVVAVVLVAVIGGLLPSVRAARTNPIEALRVP
jgi:predicted permease